jgi:hypothetical protein
MSAQGPDVAGIPTRMDAGGAAGIAEGRPVEQPQQAVAAPPHVAPYHAPPPMPPPGLGKAARAELRAVVALELGVLGILFGLPLGIPGMILGTLAYFMGKSALRRIEGSAGSLGGRSLAAAAWVLGIAGMAVGSVVTLVWLLVLLIGTSGLPA